MGRITPKIVLFCGDLDCHVNTWFLGLTWSAPPNGISMGSAVFAQYISVTSIQTHRHTDHATSDIYHNRPHLWHAFDAA